MRRRYATLQGIVCCRWDRPELCVYAVLLGCLAGVLVGAVHFGV